MQLDPKPLDPKRLQLDLKSPAENKKLIESRKLAFDSPYSSYIFRVLLEEDGQFYSDGYCKVTPQRVIFLKDASMQTDDIEKTAPKAQALYINSRLKEEDPCKELYTNGKLSDDIIRSLSFSNFEALMKDVEISQKKPDSYIKAFLKVTLATSALVSAILLTNSIFQAL